MTAHSSDPRVGKTYQYYKPQLATPRNCIKQWSDVRDVGLNMRRFQTVWSYGNIIFL